MGLDQVVMMVKTSAGPKPAAGDEDGKLQFASASVEAPAFVRGVHDGVDERLATQATLADVKTAIELLSTSITPYNSIGAAAGTAKNSPGALRSFMARNRSTSTRLYLWLFDNTTQSGTALWQPVIVDYGTQVSIGTDVFGSHGIAASVGISWGFSTSETSYSEHGTPAECSFSAAVK